MGQSAERERHDPSGQRSAASAGQNVEGLQSFNAALHCPSGQSTGALFGQITATAHALAETAQEPSSHATMPRVAQSAASAGTAHSETDVVHRPFEQRTGVPVGQERRDGQKNAFSVHVPSGQRT